MKFLGLILLATSVAGRFTEDFYRLLAKENADKNLIASAFSVEMALTLAYMGAEGNTADQLRTALKLPTDKKQVASKYKELLSNLKGREKDVILEIANRMYINDHYSPVPEYNEVLRDSFQAEAVPISLSNSENAANIVNQWVSSQTRGKITDIVSKNDLSADIIAVLLNAIYFKGQWEKQFKEHLTTQRTFKVSRKEFIRVQMMSQFHNFRAAYLNDLDAKVIELPYRNSNLSMLIYVPNEVGSLSQLEEKIIGYSPPLCEWNVHLELPKFKIEFEQELTSLLQQLGIRDAFVPGANFKGIVHDSSMYIYKVLQKAFVEVNEEGAEAAAVTIITTDDRSSDRKEKTMIFKVDQPFAYIIRDKETVYFQGHVIRPTSK